MVITRKIKIYPQGNKEEVNRVYAYIRNGMEVQSIMMNQCISALYMAKMRHASKDEILELKRLYGRIPSSKKGSAYTFDMAKYPTGLPLAGGIARRCEQKLDKSIKDGLLYGRVSLPTYKKDMPLDIHKDWISVMLEDKTIQYGLYHDYDSPGELCDALENDAAPKVHIRFANNITFDVIFGNPYKAHEMRVVFERIFSGEYEVCGSSIGFDKRTGKKLILNLCLQVPEEDKNKLDENIVVGVDRGLAHLAVCALNTDAYKRESIGTYDDFVRKRMQIQAQRKSLQGALKTTKGGHGRGKKLRHLERLETHEREFVKNYNHIVSRKVVEFALKNHAKYINLENLSGFGEEEGHEFVLRNWSYFELQTMIQYKAAKEGIVVRFVAPAYTSQTCSVCGALGIRSSQSVFTCTNPDCKSGKMYYKPMNADFNAARNIAMSENFLTKE